MVSVGMKWGDSCRRGVCALALLLVSVVAQAQRDSLLQRVFSYPERVRSECSREGRPCLPTDTFTTNVYTKYRFEVARRNVTMLTVPNMFHIAHGRQRDFFGELYSTVQATDRKVIRSFRHVHVSNVRRRRSTLSNVRPYLTPSLYGVTLVDGTLLSPFHQANRNFYGYETKTIDSLSAIVSFEPKLANTQLVSGEAVVDHHTGRLKRVMMEGEYDMVRFKLYIQMGDSGLASLRVERCEANVVMSFLGNRINAYLLSLAGLPVTLSRDIDNVDSLQLISSLRPEPLTHDDSLSIQKTEVQKQEPPEEETAVDSVEVVHKDRYKEAADAVWDVIQDKMLNRIRADFGDADRHQLRIGPIFNPLYLGYSKSRGVTYRLRMDFQYRLGENSRLKWELNGGYSFKQKQVYYNMPVTWLFNERRDGYVRLELDGGNRITNSDVLEHVKQTHRGDTLDFNKLNLDYFRDLSLRLVGNYALTPKLAVQAGFVYHRRSAVDPTYFRQMQQPHVFRSFATLAEVAWRPLGLTGPVFTTDYEHAIPHTFNSDARYDRWEFDAAYQLHLPCTRVLSLRGGLGFYLSKGKKSYFLDYTNFRRNNIPGGWRDDNTGEFELLSSAWYNASDYYVRANATYESPLLVLSRMPWVGRLVERERIYLGVLAVRNYFPYIECGYGVTNRLCSVATFFAFSSHGYEGFGVRFGFELFSDW